MKLPIETISERAREANPTREGDYIAEDGLLHCGVCGVAKECMVTFYGKSEKQRCICDCDRAQQVEEAARRKAERIEQIREQAFPDPVSRSITFDTDDTPESEIARIARNYAKRFDPLSSGWLLLYGGCGTGKSFLAACICNAVIDRGFTAKFTSVSEIERELWRSEDKGTVLEHYNHYDLLVLDDLFSERDTTYMNEITFDVIDLRYRSRKPLLITSNISSDEFAHPKDQSKNRVYSRISELALPVLVNGKDKRREKLRASAAEEIRKLLSDE